MEKQEKINSNFQMYLAMAGDVSRNNLSINKLIPASEEVGKALAVCNSLMQPLISELYLYDGDYTRKIVSDIIEPYGIMIRKMMAVLDTPDAKSSTRGIDNYANKTLYMGYIMFQQSFSELFNKLELYEKVAEDE